MIVISHPWEYVPKGSSHLNYHTDSINNKVGTKKFTASNTTGSDNQLNANDAESLITDNKNRNVPSLIKNNNQYKNIKLELNNSSLTDFSFVYLQKTTPAISNLNFETQAEKWHLKHINDFCENEIFIKDNKVILSYGGDDSKIIKRTFIFDTPVFDCNWFNFKTDSNEEGLIKDALCIFESQKLHVYFQNGSDYHLPLPFKLKNCWKLSNGILMERFIDYNNSRTNQSSQTYFTLSNPLDELKPVLCKSPNQASKGTYLRENSKQVIVDVIESLNLILVFSILNNVHYIYRISEYISEDCQNVNNLLNATGIHLNEQPSAEKVNLLNASSYKNIGTPQKRLSVSPIISTFSFYNKLNLNSPLSGSNQQTSSQTTVTSNTTTQITTGLPSGPSTQTTSLISAHQHYFQRNFSPMAALVRSPSCSSSPSVITTSSIRRTINSNIISQPIPSITSTTSHVRVLPISSHLQVNQNSIATPFIEINNTPYSNNQQSNILLRTPSNPVAFNTPLNNFRRAFTPHSSANLSSYCNSKNVMNNTINMENPCESIHEQMLPEYCFDLIWTEPVMISGDSSFNEKASKFFQITDLYNQKYVCYLLPTKNQLRFVKIECETNTNSLNENKTIAFPSGMLTYIPAKDAVFVENRNLMVIIDNHGSLIVYSGITKLCKLQLHNIQWSSQLASQAFIKQNKSLIHSPIITPVKSNIFQTKAIDMSNDEIFSAQQKNLFKTPKQGNHSLMSKSIINSANIANKTLPQATNLLQLQHEFKGVSDPTGSRFSVKLNDNRLVRVNLSESSTSKLVNMCLEAFKYSLNKEIYYEIIQQWYIHRYTIGGESIKDQLNLFLHLILNLCGCFDMNKVENVLTFLINSNSKNAKQCQNEEISDIENLAKSDQPGNESLASESKQAKSKRTNFFQEGNDNDFSFLVIDESIKGLKEFNINEIKSKLNIQSQVTSESTFQRPKIESIYSTPNSKSNVNENVKSSGSHFRLKRPIGSTTSNLMGAPNQNFHSTQSTGGLLFPYLKHILYTMHLVYEESKLYRSLKTYSKFLIQILYLLATELNLRLYMNYYESEYPFLLKLKNIRNLSTSNNGTASSTVAGSLNYKGSTNYLTNLLNQEPPVLHNFLLKLIEEPFEASISKKTMKSPTFSLNSLSMDSSSFGQQNTEFINPFPVIASVTKRTIKTIKIYALIALSNRKSLRKKNFNDFLNQLFFKINFTGFQDNTNSEKNAVNTTPKIKATEGNKDKKNINTLQSQNTFNNGSKFNFKPGEKFIHENIFALCLEMGLCTLNELYDYPFCVLFPVLEAVHWSRENPNLSWPSYAFDLIGRDDLTILKINSDQVIIDQQSQQKNNSLNDEANLEESEIYSNKNEKQYSINRSFNFLEFGKKRSFRSRNDDNPILNNEEVDNETSLSLRVFQNTKKEEEDGMQHIMQLETFKCRYNQDLRIKEVRTCLQTTRAIQIKLTQGPDVTDHDFIEEEEKFLSYICVRTMSLAVGRGLLTLHTINPIPTEPVIIPDLNLKGKSVTKKTTIDLTRLDLPSNITYWPLFHNGVASGLTIQPHAQDLSSSWIKSHLSKNFELTNEQAGFLYGLGLTGHLANFSILNVHDALTKRHDLTNIAILLGLASSKIGSMDLSVTRLISMHIKALMPPVEIELEIPYNIQIAALLSLGLVYVKSANKHISYVLLKEIGRLPGNEIDKDVHSLDREAYSLTAGLALGMVLLEKGKKSLTIMDSTFTDELYHYMVGGHKEKLFESNSNSSQFNQMQGANTGSNGQNTVNSGNQSSSNPEQNFPGSISSTNFRTTQSSYIREGESINTNVTCPGATLALGLIYFNSCDKLISEWFLPPDSAFLLDSIRPDFLLLKTIARNLIMWKYILPSQKWIINQLSTILKTNFKTDPILNKNFSHLFTSDKPNLSTQKNDKEKKLKNKTSQFSNSKKFLSKKKIRIEKVEKNASVSDESINSSEDEFDANTDEDDNVLINKEKSKSNFAKKKATQLLGDLIRFDDIEDDNLWITESEDEVDNKNKKDFDEDYDEITSADFEENSSQSANLIDIDTKTEAFRHIIAGSCMSIGLKFAGTCNNEAYETLLFWAKYFTDLNDTKLSTENCLCVILISLAMVMAGSGDLEVLRLCRYLRSRVGAAFSHVMYGSQMAISMSLSLLFIGGGRYTLKTDALSIALMLCAFYPHFPVDSNDNRFHLQAFRHLYVLASESRLLLSKDVDTNEFCYVPLEITLKACEHHEAFVYQQMAPCILPEINRIKELKILGPRYYPIKFKESLHFRDLKSILNSELYVKQKNGYFSYSDDPNDEKAFNIRNFLNKIIIPHKINPELLEEITNEDHVNFFAKMLNKSNENKLNSKTNRLLKIIYEAVVQETFDFVGIMLLLDKESTSGEKSSHFIQQMKLVDKFYKNLTTKSNKIISREFLYSTINSLETKLRNKLKRNRNIIRSYLNDEYVDGIEHLIHYCIFNNVKKADLQCFINCTNMTELIKPKYSNTQIEKLLKLYQLFK